MSKNAKKKKQTKKKKQMWTVKVRKTEVKMISVPAQSYMEAHEVARKTPGVKAVVYVEFPVEMQEKVREKVRDERAPHDIMPWYASSRANQVKTMRLPWLNRQSTIEEKEDV